MESDVPDIPAGARTDPEAHSKVERPCCEYFRLTVQQFCGLFVFCATLLMRRWVLYGVHLVIPVLGLSYIKLMDYLMIDFVKPSFDAVLQADNPFGQPHNWTGPGASLPELLNGLTLGMDMDINSVPSRILYSSAPGIDIGTRHANGSGTGFLNSIRNFNVSYFGPSSSFVLEERPAMFFDFFPEDDPDASDPFTDPIDALIHQELYDEEFGERDSSSGTSTVWNRVLGAIRFLEYEPNERLKYVMEFERNTMKRKSPLASLASEILAIKNNYSTVTEFCRKIGVAMHTFECDSVLGTLLMSVVNSAFVWDSAGVVTNTRIRQMPFRSGGFEYVNYRGDLRLSFVLPFTMIVLLPLFAFSLSFDKETGVRNQMNLMGLKKPIYVIVRFVIFFWFYCVYVAILYAYGRYVMKFRIFTMMDSGLMLLFAVGTGVSLIGFSFVFSAFFNTGFGALFGGYTSTMILPGFLMSIAEQSIGEGAHWALKFIDLIFPMQVVDTVLQLKRPMVYHHVSIGFDFLWKHWELAAAMIALYVSSVLYIVVYWYLSEVLPQPFRVRKHPLYCFASCSSCCGCCRKGKKKRRRGRKMDSFLALDDDWREDGDVRREREEIEGLGEDDLKEYGVVIRNLAKRYPRAHSYAVGGVSYRVAHGKNGAGKTTTIKVITGETSPTFGEAFVNGHSILTEMSSIRSLVGVCEQFDNLVGELTPIEHLLFYARIRGVPLSEQRDHVETIMRETELFEVSESQKNPAGCSSVSDCLFGDKKVRSLNAGMKRRLSIAIALVGNPQILYLDEPTTGLDIQSRMSVWNVILRLKKTRSLLLTTHSMAYVGFVLSLIPLFLWETHREAEELSDRIGIMSKGRMVALGPSLHLKQRFGKGYRLKVKYREDCRLSALRFINSVVGYRTGRRIVKDFGGILIWEIPKSEHLQISELFTLVEDRKDHIGILDWSLNMTSLEDVFVRLVSTDEMDPREMAKELDTLRMEVSRLEEELHVGEDESLSPDVVVAGEEEFLSSDPELEEEKQSLVSGEKSRNKSQERLEKNQLVVWGLQLYVLLKKSVLLSYRRLIPTVASIVFSGVVISMLVISFAASVAPDKKLFYDPVPLELFPPCFSGEETPSHCYQLIYATNDHLLANQMMEYLITSSGDLSKTRYFASSSEMFDWMFENPNRTMVAVDFDPISLVPPGLPYVSWTLLTNSTCLTGPRGDFRPIVHQMEHRLTNALLYVQTGKEDMVDVELQSFPRFQLKAKHAQYTIYTQIGTMFFALCNVFVLIFSSHTWVWDKEAGLISFLRAIGVRELPLFLSYAITFFLYAVCSSAVAYLTSYVLNVPVFRFQDPFLGFGTLLLYSLNLLSMTSMFLPFFSTSRGVQSFNMVFVFISFYTAFLFDGTVLYSVYDRSESYFVTYFLLPFLLPSLSFCKLFVDASTKTLPIFNYQARRFEDNVGYGWSDLFERPQMTGLDLSTQPPYIWLLWLIGSTLVYLVLALVFGLIVESWYVRSVCSCCCCYDRKRRQGEEEGEESSDLPPSITLQDVRKTYDAWWKGLCGMERDFVLQSLNLDVPANSLTVLLAQNGSGKTTAMNLLTVSAPITSGEAFILGHSVTTDPTRVRKALGYVPQHSVVQERLTAGETLELFALCKGLRFRLLETEIDSVLRLVSLVENKNDLVGTFSGGMKRRMSVAISLIASPDVLLMDEPTTGVDPYSRYGIWQVLHNLKTKKAILLTTHNIEEAEFLADRVAIMTRKGVIAVHDETLALQRKFGSGYSLSILLKEGPEGITGLKHFAEQFDLERDDDEDQRKGRRSVGQLLHTFVIPSARFDVLTKTIEALEKIEKKRTRHRHQRGGASVIVNEEEEGEDEEAVVDVEESGLLGEGDSEDDADKNGRCFFQSWGVSQSSLEELYRRYTEEEVVVVEEDETADENSVEV